MLSVLNWINFEAKIWHTMEVFLQLANAFAYEEVFAIIFCSYFDLFSN